jgi:hypothetical protein
VGRTGFHDVTDLQLVVKHDSRIRRLAFICIGLVNAQEKKKQIAQGGQAAQGRAAGERAMGRWRGFGVRSVRGRREHASVSVVLRLHARVKRRTCSSIHTTVSSALRSPECSEVGQRGLKDGLLSGRARRECECKEAHKQLESRQLLLTRRWQAKDPRTV